MPIAAICRVIEQRGAVAKAEALDAIAEKLLDLAGEGDIQALKELGDRLDGKPTQTIAGDAENPLQTRLIIGE